MSAQRRPSEDSTTWAPDGSDNAAAKIIDMNTGKQLFIVLEMFYEFRRFQQEGPDIMFS
jgi:hypothetical protein